MDELDVSRYEHIDEAFFKELVSCDFVIKKQNIVMIGNPGTGKTHLSIALGMEACIQGMNVMFYTAANLSNELIEAQDNHRLFDWRNRYPKYPLMFIYYHLNIYITILLLFQIAFLHFYFSK